MIHTAGNGGVGFYLNAALSRAGYDYTTYDADTMSGGQGHTRLPRAVNPMTKKIDLLRGFLLVSMGIQAAALPKFVDSKFTGREVKEGDLVVDCTDAPMKERKKFWKQAKQRGARILRVSYDGLNGTITVSEGLPMVGGRGNVAGIGNYVQIPSVALSFAAGGIGAMAVMEVLNGRSEYVEFQVSMDQLIPAMTAPTIAA